MNPTPMGKLVRRRMIICAVPAFAAIAAWALHHITLLLKVGHRDDTTLVLAYAVMFALFIWQTVLYQLDRPARTTPRQQHQLDAARVMVPIPAYNENPDGLRRSVIALLEQTRRPDVIYVVDDGSDEVDYAHLQPWFHQVCRQAGVRGYWTRQANGGKRQAQATAIRQAARGIDFIWTVDSDVLPDRRCLAEGLKPFFTDPTVQSVASVVLTANIRGSLLARFMDLLFVSLQLTDRAAMSAAGSVMVNSGASAFYRAGVIIDNLDAYLNETFFGREVHISDDSMLTLFALLRGRTVQQPTSLVFTFLPERLRQHVKQQIRWDRGSFIRSWWRMRYLPTKRFAFWWHLVRWLGFGVNTAILAGVFVVGPAVVWPGWEAYMEMLGLSAVIQVAAGFAVMLRYFSIRRSDVGFWYQLGTYLLTPVAVAWSATVLRGIRWYALATCLNMAWGTRKTKGGAPAAAVVSQDDTPTVVLPRITPWPAVAGPGDGAAVAG